MKVAKRPAKGTSRKAKSPGKRAAERPSRRKSIEKSGDGPQEGGFLFNDPYWDDTFCSYYDPTLRTCCR